MTRWWRLVSASLPARPPVDRFRFQVAAGHVGAGGIRGVVDAVREPLDWLSTESLRMARRRAAVALLCPAAVRTPMSEGRSMIATGITATSANDRQQALWRYRDSAT